MQGFEGVRRIAGAGIRGALGRGDSRQKPDGRDGHDLDDVLAAILPVHGQIDMRETILSVRLTGGARGG